MAECPKCGFVTDDIAQHRRGIFCQVAADGFRRGIRLGVALALQHASVGAGTGGDAWLDSSDVDAALEQRLKEIDDV